MSSQVFLSPSGIVTWAWKPRKLLGSCTVQGWEVSTSPCLLIHRSRISFPSAVTCAGGRPISSLMGTRAPHALAGGQSPSGELHVPKLGPPRGRKLALPGRSLPGQLSLLLGPSHMCVRFWKRTRSSIVASLRTNALSGPSSPEGRQAHRLLIGALSFLLPQKKFYGPQKRKMMFMGFVRLGVWYNFFRAWNGGFSGNLEGEGFILGGVYVVGPGKQVRSSCSRVVCGHQTLRGVVTFPTWSLAAVLPESQEVQGGEGRGVSICRPSVLQPPAP